MLQYILCILSNCCNTQIAYSIISSYPIDVI